MTIQEAYKKITSSEDLKKKAIEALKNGKGDEFLKEQEIDLTVEQIKEYLEKRKSGELTKAELDMAAGGCSNPTCDVFYSIYTVLIGCYNSIILDVTDTNRNNSKYRECELYNH